MIQGFKDTTTNLLTFVKTPSETAATQQSFSHKAKALFYVLVLDVLLMLVLSGLIYGVEKLGWIDNNAHAIVKMLRDLPILAIMISGVMVIPFLEELLFRYGLRFSQTYLTILLLILLASLGVVSFSVLPFAWAIAAIVALAVVMVIYFINSYRIGTFLRQIWMHHYKSVFYTSAILFGLVHITNYEYTTAVLLLTPVLVAPQIVAGFLNGYMRVKYGFMWSYYAHGIHNALFFSLALFFGDTVTEKLNIKNDNYALKIEEVNRINDWHENNTTTTYAGGDSIAFVGVKLDDAIMSLLQKDKTCMQFDDKQKLDRIINLNFRNYTSDKNQNNEIILAQLQELYKFDITTDKLEQLVWDLEINEHNILAKYAAEDSVTSRITTTPKTISLESATLQELLKTVGKEFSVTMNDNIAHAGRYNFKFAKNGFKQFQEDLKTRYGLTLQPNIVLTEQAIVNFRK